MNSARLLGVVLIVFAFGIAVIAGLFLAVQTNDGLESGGMIVGAGLAFIIVTIIGGMGIFFYVRGGQEAEQESIMAKQRQLLDILKSRGQVGVHEMALEMNVTVETLQNMVHQLVGLQVFSGYVNWDDGTLYSSDARHLRDLDACKKCGAPIELVGKGVVACKYCGTEYFLT